MGKEIPNKLQPFRRAWVPTIDHELVDFVVYLDGGKLGFGCTIHSISSSKLEPKLDMAFECVDQR